MYLQNAQITDPYFKWGFQLGAPRHLKTYFFKCCSSFTSGTFGTAFSSRQPRKPERIKVVDKKGPKHPIAIEQHFLLLQATLPLLMFHHL